MNYPNTSTRCNPDKLRAQRARAYERRKRREAIANHWGLSTLLRRPTREDLLRRGEAERLCNACIATLETGGDGAAIIAAMSHLVVAEWRALMRHIADAFGREDCVIWRCVVDEDDMARIEYALHLFQPGAEHWAEARKRLALTTYGPTLDADPSVLMLRLVSGFDRERAPPCDQTMRALIRALKYVFRRDDGWQRFLAPHRSAQSAGGGR